MNLHEHIRHILREETKINPLLRRRLHLIDDEVEMRLRTIYSPKNICRFVSGEELLEVITDAVIDNMYFKFFSGLDDDGRLWNEVGQDMDDYIKNKYGDKIMKYYHINCGK
jgi:hypothetical protein